tara:strand:- start:1334 stop:1969 length:636 start_codon:yes stop_codon:yes gene_type:complete
LTLIVFINIGTAQEFEASLAYNTIAGTSHQDDELGTLDYKWSNGTSLGINYSFKPEVKKSGINLSLAIGVNLSINVINYHAEAYNGNPDNISYGDLKQNLNMLSFPITGKLSYKRLETSLVAGYNIVIKSRLTGKIINPGGIITNVDTDNHKTIKEPQTYLGIKEQFKVYQSETISIKFFCAYQFYFKEVDLFLNDNRRLQSVSFGTSVSF